MIPKPSGKSARNAGQHHAVIAKNHLLNKSITVRKTLLFSTETTMANILILAELNPNKLGSFEEQTICLCTELIRRGHTCFCGFIAEADAEVKRKFEDVGAEIFITPYSLNDNLFTKLKNSFSCLKFVRRNKISLIHINFYSLTSLRLFGVYFSKAKIIFTDHMSGSGHFYRGFFRTILSKIVHFILSKRVYIYIAVSEYVRTRFCKTYYLGKNKSQTIYYGINLDRFKPGNLDTARIEIGLPLGGKIVSTVAHMIPAKGIQHLIEAIALLHNENCASNLLFVIAGEGPYLQTLEDQVKDLHITDNVIFLGKRNDIHTIIAASDIIVVPSIWEEAFGLIIVEAMACAKPVITSRIGGIPELVEDDKTGILVASGHAGELATAIKRLLDDPDLCQIMGQNALKKATSEHDVVKYVKKLANIYDQCLNG
jgi:glycosyltransferase involved in cell wall biosynthesis